MRSEQQGIIPQRNGFDFRMLQRSSQANFCLLPKHHLEYFLGMTGANADCNFRKFALKSLENVWQEVNRDGEARGNLQRCVASWPELVHGLARDRRSL